MNVLKESFVFARRYMAVWIAVILLGITGVVCYNLLPQATQLLIDRVINPALGETPVVNESNPFNFLLNGVAIGDYMTMFLRIAAVCLSLAFVRYVCHYVRWNVSHAYGVRMERRMRGAVFTKMLSQNSIVLDRYTSGNLLSICNSDSVVVKDFYSLNLPIFIDQICVVVLAVFFLARMDPWLILCPLALAVLSGLSTVRYTRTLRRRYTEIRDCAVNLNTMISENINGVRIIRAYASEDIEVDKFDKVNDAYRKAYVSHAKTVASYQALFNLLGQAINIVSIIIGVLLAVRGKMSVGEFSTFIAYVGMINPALINIVNYIGAMQNAVICGNRVFTFLNTANVIRDKPNAEPIDGNPNITLRNVSVCLDDNEQIHNVDLDLPYGKKLGIMGKTGAGKSVLIKTLPRLFEATGGEVRINGNLIKSYRVEDVRRLYSLVFQDVFLFSDTVESNIAFYDPDAPIETVRHTAELADAAGFIEKLPLGYDTIVGERGIGLSGGQKQRISMARAFLKNAPVLLLDDCTSALDLETERRILHNIDTEFGDKTVVIASHRATSVMHCDEIIFLENGRIVERGTHDELLQLKGKYYETYTSQDAQAKEALL